MVVERIGEDAVARVGYEDQDEDEDEEGGGLG